MALAALSAAVGLAWIGRLAPRTAIVSSCVLAIAFSLHMPITFVLERRVQHEVEDRVRTPMAQYLDQVVLPGQRVTSESAGYVGYYSDVTLYDYPGLTSPGALHALHDVGPHRNSLFELVRAVHPEWLVMRPSEWTTLIQLFPKTAALYVLDRVFRVKAAESGLRFGGVEYMNIDRDFMVLRRVGTSRPLLARS